MKIRNDRFGQTDADNVRGEKMNEKFYELPEEKRLRIINAAMEVFSQNEYKRASTDLIAAKAGVSKGLLFYYFHNKKELYLYLYDYVAEVMKEQVVDEGFKELTDFFELLSYCSRKKVSVLKKNPYITDFAVKAFYSEKEDVSEELKQYNVSQTKTLYDMYFSNIDTYKFKEDADPYKVMKMLIWMADGYLHSLQMEGRTLDIDMLMEEFNDWMQMMRKLVYKEEYLNECD